MSYTRTFSKVISVPYSGYVTAKDGSSVHYSGTEHETVHVTVHVDTSDFDSSVGNCGSSVDLLTGSVVATESAQAASIKESSQKISRTLISGFFKTVRSELGQQIAQLKSQTEATLLHLNKMAQRCREKHTQMETDYNRLVERYSKVFSDLNKELEIRVFELDRQAFKLQETTTECANRSISSDLTGVAVVSAGENARVQSSLLASVAKKRAFDAISQANAFLLSQQQCRSVVNRALHDADADTRFYVPVCLADGVDETSPQSSKATLYKPSVVPNSARRQMISALKKARWQPMPAEARNIIKREFTRSVAQAYPGDSPHERRVKDYLNRFIDIPIHSL